jgi:hypothetical protein
MYTKKIGKFVAIRVHGKNMKPENDANGKRGKNKHIKDLNCEIVIKRSEG